MTNIIRPSEGILATTHSNAQQPENPGKDTRTYFSLVQFVPNEVRDERLSIGIILQAPSDNFAGVRIRPYMDGLLNAIWPQVDAELIRGMARAIESDLHPLDKPIKKTGAKLLELIPDEKATPRYLQRYTQSYGSIQRTEPKPVRVREGVKYQDKLEQLFDLHVGMPNDKASKQNITKDIIRFSLARQLQKHEVVYTENFIVPGEFFRNKFDISRPHLDGPATLVHTISFDTDTGDQSVSQCLRLLHSVADISSARPKYRDLYEFAVFLQPPRNRSQNHQDYSDAVKALKKEFIIFQNLHGIDQETSRLAEALKAPGGLRSAS